MLKNSKEAAYQGPRVLGCIIYSILHKYLIEPVPIFYYAALIQNVYRNISQKMKMKLQRTGSKTRKLLHVARTAKSCSKSKKLLEKYKVAQKLPSTIGPCLIQAYSILIKIYFEMRERIQIKVFHNTVFLSS